MLYDASRAGNLSPSWFDPQYWEARGELDGSARGRGTTHFVRSAGRRLVLRHYRRGGLMARLLGDRYLWHGEQSTRPFDGVAADLPAAPRGAAGARAARGALPPAGFQLHRRPDHRAAAGRRLAHRVPAHRGAVGADVDLHRALHPPLPRPGRVPRRPQRAQRAAERGCRVPDRLRSLPAARAGAVVRRQSGAPAALAREGDVRAAAGALRRSRLARSARRLPPGRRRCRRRPSDARAKRLRFLYLLAVYLAAPIVSGVFLWRGLRDRSYWRNFGERFGFGAAAVPHGVWMHAVSVGEVQACAPLVGALRAALSRSAADRHRRSHPPGPRGRARCSATRRRCATCPSTCPGRCGASSRVVQPRLAVIFETELWPNLYRECGRRRVPLVLASARISPRSAGRYRRLGALFRDTLSQAAVVAAQGAGDAERFRALGADPASTHVTGNLKFDFELPPQTSQRGARLRAQYARGPAAVGRGQHATAAARSRRCSRRTAGAQRPSGGTAGARAAPSAAL